MRKLLNEELERLSPNEFKDADKLPLIVILDNVRSLNNIGSVFRTCDAFRLEEILLCGISATPPNKEIHKTALGATESVTWQYFESTMDALSYVRSRGYILLAIEQVEEAAMLDKMDINSKSGYGLVFGHEIRGVDQEVVNACDGCIEIPQSGTKHSLNISVAAGIVLWEFYRKMKP